MAVTHVVFDLDGLLLGKRAAVRIYLLLYTRDRCFPVDTEKIYTVVTQSILDRYGKKFEWSVKSKLMGLPPIESTTVLIESLDLPMTPQEYLAEAQSKLEERFVEADLMPGMIGTQVPYKKPSCGKNLNADKLSYPTNFILKFCGCSTRVMFFIYTAGAAELIKHLHAHNIPMAVATSSKRREYDLKVTRHQELFELMSHIVCTDDPLVEKGKPAPDIYLAAAKRFPSPPKSSMNVMVLEDAASGVQAAKAAGMICVMVPDKRLDPARTKQADQVLKSLSELNLTEFGLPCMTN